MCELLDIASHTRCIVVDYKLIVLLGFSRANEFIQLNFNNIRRVGGISTVGRHISNDSQQYVTSYTVQYQQPTTHNWLTISDRFGSETVGFTQLHYRYVTSTHTVDNQMFNYIGTPLEPRCG